MTQQNITLFSQIPISKNVYFISFGKYIGTGSNICLAEVRKKEEEAFCLEESIC